MNIKESGPPRKKNMEKTRCRAKSRRGVKMIMMIMYTKFQVFLGSDDAEFLGINCINVMYQHLQIWQTDVAKGTLGCEETSK